MIGIWENIDGKLWQYDFGVQNKLHLIKSAT